MGSILNRLRPKPAPTVVTPEPAVTTAPEAAATPAPEAGAEREERTEAPEPPSE
jgi:hypothetical protein